MERSGRTARSRSANVDLSLKGADRSKGCTAQKYSPTTAAASFRVFLATVAAKDGELRHFDAGRHS